MKKVLILAYDFPPYVSVGGLRPRYWYENFKGMGLFPIIVTRNWNPIHGNALDYIQPSKTKEVEIEETEKGILIKAPYKANLSNRLTLKDKKDPLSNLLKKTSTGWNEIGQWFLPIGTKYELYKAAKNFLKDNKVDVILATGEPFILFKYASKLSRKFNTPWVADYRDQWSQSASRRKGLFFKYFSPSLEKKYLKNVCFISTVSEYLRFKIQEYVKNKPFVIIPNGYNENMIIENTINIQNNEVLTISLAGTIYNWHPCSYFLDLISNFLQDNPNANFNINFYGTNKENSIRELLENDEKLKKIITMYPKMSNDKLAMELAKSNILLLFNDYSIMGTKIYDYLALNRKIILCFEDDKEANLLKEKYFKFKSIKGLSESLQTDLIKKTNSGIIVKDSEHLYNILKDLCNEFEEKSYIENHTIGAENYSRKVQTEKLVNELKQIENYDNQKL
jgi:hypothetical protein